MGLYNGTSSGAMVHGMLTSRLKPRSDHAAWPCWRDRTSRNHSLENHIYNCGSESESIDMFAQTHITFSGTNMKTVASTSPQQRPAKTVFLHLFGLRGGRDPWMACRFPSHQSTRIYSTKKNQSCYPPVIKHGNFG